MAVKKLAEEVRAGLVEGRRSDLLDFYWLAVRGLLTEEEAKRERETILLVRQLMGEPYHWITTLEQALAELRAQGA